MSGDTPTDVEQRHSVLVVGSINHDVGIGLERMPVLGETVLGDDARWAPGGKGSNQAVACARLGLDVTMVGALGNDASGEVMAAALASEGVDIRHVERVEAATGLAVVLVDRTGESTIVVSPGANAHVSPAAVEAASDALRRARAVLCQLEIPLDTVSRAAELTEGLFVLNPAPGRALPSELLARTDVLVPNRYELAQLVGAAVPDSIDGVERLAHRLEGPGAIVVTLGADGALVVEDSGTSLVPAVPVTAVDTTSAGDSFCAGLVAALLAGADLVSATQAATRVGAATATCQGAMDSLPRTDEVDARLLAYAAGD